MAAIDWPSDLPCPGLPIGYQLDSFVVRDVPEIGAPRARARFTRSLRQWQTVVPRLTRQQADQLEEFYNTTLSLGTKTFNVSSPRANPDGTPNTIEAKMMNLQFERAGTSSGERWNATFDLYEV